MTPAYSRLSPQKRLSSVTLVTLAAAFAVALAGPARADDTTQRAKELFQQGTTLFNVGEFDKAIEAWQQGYKEKPDPGFLYNIGQAYRHKGDATKAIFFYRGYLRNSPKATNRAEVEAKITALQKTLDERPGASPAATPPPVTAPAPAVPATAPPRATPPPARPAPVQARPVPVAPPPVAAPPLPEPQPASPSVVVESPAPAAPEVIGRNRHVDLALAGGINSFTSGLNIQGDAPAQFAFNVAAGFTFGHGVFAPASFRMGVLINRTTLPETIGNMQNTLGFTSLLVEPSVRIRLMERRLFLTGGLGIGAVVITGVTSRSVLLAPLKSGQSYDVQGAQGGLELRPAVGLQLHVSDSFVLFASPALAFTPKKANFYGALGRFELMFGIAYLL